MLQFGGNRCASGVPVSFSRSSANGRAPAGLSGLVAATASEAPPRAPRKRPRRIADRLFAETGVPAVAVGLVVCAVVAPVVAWRAADWAGTAAGADQRRLENTQLAGARFSQDAA